MRLPPPVLRASTVAGSGDVAIQLTRDMTAVVSPEDAILSSANWYAKRSHQGPTYAIVSVVGNDRKKFAISMHSVVWARMGKTVPDGLVIDHKDGNGLNNRRDNLRLADGSLNNANRGAQRNGRSGYKGVIFHRGARSWRARINVRGARFDLGSFANVIDAALAYDRAARVHFGEFAFTNYPAFAAGDDRHDALRAEAARREGGAG